MKNLLNIQFNRWFYHKFQAFLKMHVQLEMSISQQKLPQNLINNNLLCSIFTKLYFKMYKMMIAILNDNYPSF